MLLSLLSYITGSVQQQQTIGLGSIQTTVPWRAGHAAAFQYPYVVVYGGTQQAITANTATAIGSNDVWIWDSRNGSWYKPTIQVQEGVNMLPQIYIKATSLPSQGQILALVSNITTVANGPATGVLQKLDLNSWSWSFPTTNFQASARVVGYTMGTINNTVFTYGGTSADSRGYPMSNAMQNTLSLMDANNFQWTPGANGLGLADHSTCFLKACNCLVTFGGTPTGNPTDVTDSVSFYDLNSKVWNVQGIPSVPGSSSPAARRLHTATCLDNIMVVYGGGTTQPTADTDVWILNATAYPALVWQKVSMANQNEGPNIRMGHSAVLDEADKKIYIFGGWGISADINDSNMYILDTDKWSWTRVLPTGYTSGTSQVNNTSSSNNSDRNNDGQKNGINTGTIVGAAVGGSVGLVLIAFAAFILLRKRKRQQIAKKGDFHSNNFSEKVPPVHGYNNDKDDNGPYLYANETRQPPSDDSDDDDDNYYVVGGGMMRDNQRRSHNQLSKAWTGTQISLARHSEIGDYSDKVKTGILEAMNDNETVAATHGSRSPRVSTSCRASKVLLVSPTEDIHNGQVPNEIISQKPNEFSVQATRHQPQQQHHYHDNYDVPVEHLTVSKKNNEGNSGLVAGPLSYTSMEVALSPSRPLTTTNSLSVSNDDRQETTPIQYISEKFSTNPLNTVCNSTQTWDTNNIPLFHHHQTVYPSSTLNMPMAQTATPSVTTNNSSSHLQRVCGTNISPQVNIYNTVSPLDALASLGQQQQQPVATTCKSSDNNKDNTVSHNASSSTTITTTILSSTSTASSASLLPHEKEKIEETFSQFHPLISALPQKYQIDKSKKPISGPANTILFATLSNDENSSKRQVVIKVFGRREAWERECRTLVKLKSPDIVEILEVLTIQQQSDAVMNETNNNEDSKINYLTVMEYLDETLNEFIKHRKNKRSSTLDDDCSVNATAANGKIAKDILRCLSWCHNRGIAFCDLKPSNIMRQFKSGGWKLIDFEGSRTINEECVGVITARYCSPEVARATTYGLEGANGVVAMASIDLWSLGCVIYELETKKALFSNNMKDETILHFLSHPSPTTPILNNGLRWNDNNELEIPQLERLIPDIQTKQLIEILLSTDPNKRGSAEQLLQHPYFC
ncbi:hypothetical protein BDF20DRAFT_914666 [Mycotypha africana]|uniref:uncharacterized protein n=1 Tax=Mycotypha africana TaxID=64632 RepID=UPI0023014E2A|nr:uncharacterized protein BDF20DRAFT_914666 [Mycotypha africana]KAI8973181.1 hypothetical protein BDF20DRAFT_914666 [Mycotypha africana]